MRIKDCRLRIQSPPSTIASASKSTNSSHCSKCSHCHPHKTKSVSSLSTGHTSSVIELGKLVDAANHPSSSLARHQLLSMPAPHFQSAHSSYPPMLQPHPMPLHHSPAMAMPMPRSMPMPIPMAMMTPHETRLHPFAPAPVLHNLGRGAEPLFGWESVMPLNHAYGQPRYLKRVKPDYRRFCFSVGKADVPFAAMPGGPLWGMDVTMAPQMVGSHRW